MSRRNREDGTPPISLFAFQDLISTLSGVFIFLVLFMAVDVALRKDVHRKTVSSKSTAASAEELRLSVGELKAEVAALEKIMQMNQLRDAVAIAKEITAAESQRDDLQHQLNRLNISRAALEDRLRVVRTEEAGKNQETEPLQEQLRQLHIALANAMNEKQLFVIPEEGGLKTPVIVECSASAIRVGYVGRNAKPAEFEPNWIGTRQFTKHLDQFSPDHEYFVFMIKPSAARYGSDLVKKAITRGFEVGYDALEEKLSIGFGVIQP